MKKLHTALAIQLIAVAVSIHTARAQATSANVGGVKDSSTGATPESVADLKQQLAAEHRKAGLSDLDARVSDATAAELQAQAIQQQAQQKVQAVRALAEQDRIELGYPEGTQYDFQKRTFTPPAPTKK